MLNLVDVGSAGGIQPKWERHLSQLNAFLFEPNLSEAEKIRGRYAGQPNIQVITKALYDTTATKTLNVTRHPGCTSLLPPNEEFLSTYPIARAFEVVEKPHVFCVRYDELHRQGIVPRPDVLKIDVQGCEFEVLSGFGGLLQGCVGVELEAHLYPLYRGQKLLGDVVELLSRFELVLRKLRPVPHFEGDLVEVDAFFTLTGRAMSKADRATREKLSLAQKVLEV
jgi:FkbM family methyltransferase